MILSPLLKPGPSEMEVIKDLNVQLYKAIKLDKSVDYQRRVVGEVRSLFDHATRLSEYPFALEEAKRAMGCSTFGRVVDIGSDLKFSVSIEPRCEELVIHNTYQDTCHLGLMRDTLGIHSIHDWFSERRDRVAMVNCLPWTSLLAPRSFDVVFCLSVLEHVPPVEFPRWLEWIKGLLKPGGVLVLTVDWIEGEPVGASLPADIWNQDYGLDGEIVADERHVGVDLPKGRLVVLGGSYEAE